MLKSVLKDLRSMEYMLSAVHSYTPASIWVAGSISSLLFILSTPICHSCICEKYLISKMYLSTVNCLHSSYVTLRLCYDVGQTKEKLSSKCSFNCVTVHFFFFDYDKNYIFTQNLLLLKVEMIFMAK